MSIELLGKAGLLDAALAYYKLSMLEARLGRASEAETYLAQAIARCSTPERQCDESTLATLEREIGKRDRERGFDW